MATAKAFQKFKLFVISSEEFTLIIHYQAIVSFYHKKAENKLYTNRWLTFVDYIVGNGFSSHWTYKRNE